MAKKQRASDRMASKGFPNPVDAYVGMRIRNRRMFIGMTQISLAKALGVEFQQVQKYEKAANRVSASRLWDISKILNVPIAYFFQGMSRDTQKQSPANLNGAIPEVKESEPMDKETLALIRVWRTMKDKSKRRMVLSITKNLAKQQ